MRRALKPELSPAVRTSRRWLVISALFFLLVSAFLIFVDVNKTQENIRPYLLLTVPSLLFFLPAASVVTRTNRWLLLAIDWMIVAELLVLILCFLAALGGGSFIEAGVLAVAILCLARSGMAIFQAAQELRLTVAPIMRHGFPVILVSHAQDAANHTKA